jgi:hypothetical protein
MNRNLIALVIPLVLLESCSNPMTAEQKITMLENQKLEILADLHRQQAECQAQAIEFANVKGGEKVVSSCMESYRKMRDAAQTSIDLLERRIVEINPSQPPRKPALIPFEGKLDGEK